MYQRLDVVAFDEDVVDVPQTPKRIPAALVDVIDNVGHHASYPQSWSSTAKEHDGGSKSFLHHCGK